MRMLPAPKRAGALEILKLAAFLVSLVFKIPAHVERAHAHSKCSAGTIVNARRWLDNFNRLPRRRKPLERTGTSVPLEYFFCGRFKSRSSNENLSHDDPIAAATGSGFRESMARICVCTRNHRATHGDWNEVPMARLVKTREMEFPAEVRWRSWRFRLDCARLSWRGTAPHPLCAAIH